MTAISISIFLFIYHILGKEIWCVPPRLGVKQPGTVHGRSSWLKSFGRQFQYGLNRDQGDLEVLALVTGETSKNAALSVTALGHDARFDFTQSFWLLAGIAGGTA